MQSRFSAYVFSAGYFVLGGLCPITERDTTPPSVGFDEGVNFVPTHDRNPRISKQAKSDVDTNRLIQAGLELDMWES